MSYRIKQLLNYFVFKYKKEDDLIAKKYLSNEEYAIFEKMTDYDKKHSVNIVKDILKSNNYKDNIYLIKASLLHDIGKIEGYNIINRIFYALTKNKRHCEKGYEIMKDVDKNIAEFILHHHDKNPENEIIIQFQKIDDVN